MDESRRKEYKTKRQSPEPKFMGEEYVTPPPTYTYSPLHPTVDSLRLVILEPSQERTGPIRCRIRHAEFGDRPKYEALSYAWGEGTASEKILIEGRTFVIGRNLLIALRHLRDETKERVIWIDAICINQADIPERNKQISIMRYIYERAQTVLVWLGVRPKSLKAKGMPLIPLDDLWKELFSGYDINRSAYWIKEMGHDLLTAMCNAPYWSRLWIIQEVSVARKVQICYGYNCVEWEAFIQAIKGTIASLENSVPMRLEVQFADKYRESHKLHRLLESHQNALCKEPRDHVYGFVAMASDCLNPFPIDYQKSLFEVWKDTIMYMNANYSASHHDIIKLGVLVRGLLGKADIALEGEVVRDLSSRMATTGLNRDRLRFKNRSSLTGSMPRFEDFTQDGLRFTRDSLRFTARLVGCICFLGPTHREIIADLNKTAQWKVNINRYTPGKHLPAVMEESDIFLELMEALDDGDLETAVPFDLETLWQAPKMLTAEPDLEVSNWNLQWNRCTYIRRHESEWSLPNQLEYHARPNTSEGRALFLLSLPNKGDDLSDDLPGSMGLAPLNAEVGDFVLQVNGVGRALIVRDVSPGALELKVVGTAILAENNRRQRASRGKIGVPEFAFRESDAVELVVDIALAYHLLVR